MAGTPIAYSEITILDLMDTATYIYYSEDENGTGATSAPTITSKYIGIYSGPALEARPESPEANWSSEVWSGWTKYVGEDGKDGNSISIDFTEIAYAVTIEDYSDPADIDKDEWITGKVPTLNQGQILWTRTSTKYNDGTETISYNKSYSGIDGSYNQYRIETSQEEILKFVSTTEQETYNYAPELLDIMVWKGDSLLTDYKLEIKADTDFINENFISKNESGEKITFKIKEFLESETGVKYQSRSSFTFVIRVYESNEINQLSSDDEQGVRHYKAIKPIICRNGVSSDMATFNLFANRINAAIQSTTLDFQAEGLIISNGGLILKNKAGDIVLNGDSNGNLAITGHIVANSGYIGQIEIKDGSLTAGNHYSISPDGIIANNITLREGAIVENYIKLGNSYLYNPDAKINDSLIRPEGDRLYRAILTSGNILIRDNNTMSLGQIDFFGGSEFNEAYISAKNNQWKIWENGRADFLNIYADNCHIGNTILEANTIQSAGNLTIFADSWAIVGVEGEDILLFDTNPKLTFSEEAGKSDVLFGYGEYYTLIEEVQQIGDIWKVRVDKNIANLSQGSILTKIGKVGDLVFSICGQGNSNVAFAVTNSLTLSRLNEDTSTISFTPELALGFLGGLGKEGVSGYGLYAENVYLKGSLTTATKNNSPTYAGINTTGNVKASVFNSIQVGGELIDDNSSIIFWAGANIDEYKTISKPYDQYFSEAIQNSPFQVTEKGTLYASQGVFEGSIISKSIIQSSDIYAARIHGWENNSKAALTIYDTSQGIIFKDNASEQEKTILKINTSGLATGDNSSFITIVPIEEKYQVNFNGYQGSFSSQDHRSIINFNSIQNQRLTSENEWITQTTLQLQEGFSLLLNEVALADFKENQISLNTNTVKIKKHIQYGENVRLLYEQVNNGYDLYIYNDV